jgi:aspartate 1-decarboxylase
VCPGRAVARGEDGVYWLRGFCAEPAREASSGGGKLRQNRHLKFCLRAPILSESGRWTPTPWGRHDATHQPLMKLNIFKSKIHRATVTHADVDYEGSVTVDADLLAAADILPHEAVHIWNVTRGTRLVTYAIEGPRGSGAVCVNGAAAHLCQAGDLVILATFADMTPEEARRHVPLVVRVDGQNRQIGDSRPETPAPALRSIPAA